MVLSSLSRGYPPLNVRLTTCYSAVRHDTIRCRRLAWLSRIPIAVPSSRINWKSYDLTVVLFCQSHVGMVIVYAMYNYLKLKLAIEHKCSCCTLKRVSNANIRLAFSWCAICAAVEMQFIAREKGSHSSQPFCGGTNVNPTNI